MKFEELMEMPKLVPTELDDEVIMTPYFIPNHRLQANYNPVAAQDNVEVWISKDESRATIGLRTMEKNVSGLMEYGNLVFKENFQFGRVVNDLQLRQQKVLQVSNVQVVREDKLKGVGSFFYSSLVKAGYTMVSDNTQYLGGQALWKKLGRAHNPDEVVYVMDSGNVLKDEQGRPLEYDGQNIPDERLWSLDDARRYVLFIYKKR